MPSKMPIYAEKCDMRTLLKDVKMRQHAKYAANAFSRKTDMPSQIADLAQENDMVCRIRRYVVVGRRGKLRCKSPEYM